jgi:GrpB-like predicted nucleotidyltransferase (UPF0157 family)
MGAVEIVPYDPGWPAEFRPIGARLREAAGELALRIDHVGSTAVPGLAAKDVIDVQITASALEPGGPLETALAARGFQRRADIDRDHDPPGVTWTPGDWEKWLLEGPADLRPANVHVRVDGRPNQRYALLFRDYLLENPITAAAYAELKRRLAAIAPTRADYADAKDPACDLIMGAAEEWADLTGWRPGPSDA